MGLFDGLLSLFGTSMNNKTQSNIAARDRQLQREENEKTRQFNRELAEWQNNMNIEQWQRERAAAIEDRDYNSPAAQMQRFEQAGLNPNLLYGQINNSGSISSPSIAGSLTSGAPATPMDYAASSPRHGMQSFSNAFERIGEAMMEIPLYREQVKNAKLNNEEKEIQINRDKIALGEDEYQKTVREFVRGLNYSPESLDRLLHYGAGNEWKSNYRGDIPETSLYNNPDVQRYLKDYVSHNDKYIISRETRDVMISLASTNATLSDLELKKVRETIDSTIRAINNKNAAEVDFTYIEKELGVGNVVVQLLKGLVQLVK